MSSLVLASSGYRHLLSLSQTAVPGGGRANTPARRAPRQSADGNSRYSRETARSLVPRSSWRYHDFRQLGMMRTVFISRNGLPGVDRQMDHTEMLQFGADALLRNPYDRLQMPRGEWLQALARIHYKVLRMSDQPTQRAASRVAAQRHHRRSCVRSHRSRPCFCHHRREQEVSAQEVVGRASVG